jgi:hypothetical protein
MTRTNSDKLDDLAELLAQFRLTFEARMEEVSNRVERLERQTPKMGGTPTGGTPEANPRDTPHAARHVLKLDVPRFSGTDPHGWIFKITPFFTYHNTPEKERITVASFYLDGEALAWYQWLYTNGEIASWAQFLQALEFRFAPTAYDDLRGKLFKLQQSGSVAGYLGEFESLANHIVGLSPRDLLSCFVSGLKPEIRREVLAQQPIDLSQAAVGVG